MIIKFSDRSRFLEQQRCPTARFLGYEWGGTGLRKIRASIPLATGSAIHEGVADMLRQVIALENVPGAWSRIDVDQSVNAALIDYQIEIKDRGLEVELGEDAQWVVDEQRALIEGLVRAYAIAPHGLQALLDQYVVLEVEQEDLWEDFTYTSTKINFQARADALLLERGTEDLYILSLKTANAWDYRKDNENRHDVQGLSEAAVVERRLKLTNPDARIMGIQMVFLIKGRRDQATEGGPYVTQSSLVHPWRREGVTEAEYAHRYKWDGPDIWPDSGRLRGHTLGKGWKRVDIWEDVGVKSWIDMLAAGEVQRDLGDPFDAMIVMPIPYYRQNQDIDDWIEQAQAQEKAVALASEHLEYVRMSDPANMRHSINAWAIPNKRSCDWPSRCQFQEICFGDPSMYVSPMSTGLYQLRVPHHEAESKAFAPSNAEQVSDAALGDG